MEPPQIPNLTIKTFLGEGGCGESYLALNEGGDVVVVKAFKAMSINRRLLGDSMERTVAAGEMAGVVPISSFDVSQRPPYLVMPFFGRITENGVESWSLQDWMNVRIPEENAWQWIVQLCEGLAGLHRLGVAHCNIKPSNVLLDDPRGGNLFVSDFGQGWVEGIYHMDPNEAYLYASPEQLMNPDGVETDGRRWDVYAFGVLAYRLLTGSFPRARDAFSGFETALFDPSVGDPMMQTAEIAKMVLNEPMVVWDTESESWEEQQRRRVIDYCLQLDPDERWIDMREVEREFIQIDSEADLRRERQRVADYKRSVLGKLKLTRVTAVVLLALLVMSAVAALVFRHKFNDEVTEVSETRRSMEQALAAKDAEILRREELVERKISDAESLAASAVADKRNIRGVLVRSQEQADKLFNLVMDKRPVSSPGFREYSDTVGELEKFYTEFLGKFDQDDGMIIERARAMTKLAELALSSGKDDLARERFSAAVGQWRPIMNRDPEDIDSRGRMAMAMLKLSRLQFSVGQVQDSLINVREAQTIFSQLAKSEGGRMLYGKWLASCHVQLGRVLRQQDDSDAAITEYREAVKIYRELGEKTGDFNFRSDLAHSYVELGKLVRGTDNYDAALLIQKDALATLVELEEERPEVKLSRFDQARAYGEIADVALELGNVDEATKAKEKAVDILTKIVEEEPDREEFVFELAKRKTGMARALRDAGQTSKARSELDKAIELLNKLRENHADKSLYAYQHALAEWQLAEMISGMGKYAEAREINERAVTGLKRILDEGGLASDQRRQIEVSLAYLYGDLAHISEQAKEKEAAVGYFRKAEAQWSHIASLHGDDPMVRDALVWCRRRLSELATQ